MATEPTQPEPDQTLSFEDALARLQAIVAELEEGQIGLNESLARYEQGIKLLRQCHDLLEKAQRKIELLSAVDEQGRPITAPLDDTALTLDEKAQKRSRRRSASERKVPGSGGSGCEEPEIDGPGVIS
jgi:exodeoxyribonuclease VII small subunit